MKVLIADDDKIVDAAISAVLRKRGWQTVVAFDAMQALMFAKQAPMPDIVLLDIGMPGGSGLMTLERLKSATLTEAIPVVVVSGSEDPELPAKVKAMGAIGFVKKPVDPEALAESIEKYFASRVKQGPSHPPPPRT
ncbi:MAG TPA: response regulator [Longimicrobiales bacterium]|nr:response regulator [Longimicrobiales bacterium]